MSRQSIICGLGRFALNQDTGLKIVARAAPASLALFRQRSNAILISNRTGTTRK
jgi:hypothetical protein